MSVGMKSENTNVLISLTPQCTAAAIIILLFHLGAQGVSKECYIFAPYEFDHDHITC